MLMLKSSKAECISIMITSGLAIFLLFILASGNLTGDYNISGPSIFSYTAAFPILPSNSSQHTHSLFEVFFLADKKKNKSLRSKRGSYGEP